MKLFDKIIQVKMKFIKLISILGFFIFIVTCISSQNITGSKNTEKKIVRRVVDPVSIAGLGISFVGLVINIIDTHLKNSKPNDKTNNEQTKELLDKFDSISKLIKEISCKIREQNKDLHLENKLKNIYNDLRAYNSIKDLYVKNNVRNELKYKCAGIKNVYENLKYFLEYKQIKDYMNSCANSRSNEVQTLVANVKYLVVLFTYTIIRCEEIFEQKSGFDLIKFGEEMDDLIQNFLYEEMKNYYRNQLDDSTKKLNELHFPTIFYKIWLKNIEEINMRCEEQSNKWKCNMLSADKIDQQNNNNINYYIKLNNLKKNNFKLIGYYHEHKNDNKLFTPEECWEKCDQDDKCYAFQTNWYDARYKKSCFLFNQTFGAVKGLFYFFLFVE